MRGLRWSRWASGGTTTTLYRPSRSAASPRSTISRSGGAASDTWDGRCSRPRRGGDSQPGGSGLHCPTSLRMGCGTTSSGRPRPGRSRGSLKPRARSRRAVGVRRHASGGARWASITDRLRAGRWGRYTDPHALCHDHFRLRSSLTHVNYDSMCYVIEALGGRPQTILETGMSAWGTDSTRLFDSYVRSFGGHLWSVDIEPEHVRRLTSRVGGRRRWCAMTASRFSLAG